MLSNIGLDRVGDWGGRPTRHRRESDCEGLSGLSEARGERSPLYGQGIRSSIPAQSKNSREASKY